MTETTTSKVEKWSYPLKIGTAEATDPQQFYKALAKAKDGYYPLGANGLWHGGVHFDEATGLVKDLTEVRCIADGEVVAYRIDEAYPKSDFGSTQSVYSTGFVLVKHRLEFPTPPAPATGTAPAAGPSLTFFSLYMHLLDWETYKSKPTLTNRPGFWGKGLYRVKSNLSTKSLGLSVRAEGKKLSTLLAVLPRGTTVLTKPAPATAKWLEIVSVTPEVAGLAPATGWVFKGQMKELGVDKYAIGEESVDVPPDQKSGANVRDATSHGLPIAFLPAGMQVRISDAQAGTKYRKLVEVVSGQPIPALTAGADGNLPGFVWFDDLEPVSEPHTPMGEVVLLTPTFKIKVGEVLGHVGKYQSHTDSTPKNLLHIEVFSCENVREFIQKCQEKAGSLPAAEKTVLKIQKNEKLILHSQGMDSTNPPKTTDSYNKVGYEFMIPVGVLEALPSEKKIKVPVVMGETTSYTYWWHLEDLLADEGGNPISGWYAEPDITLSRHSPFEWEGFTFIEETVSNVDHLAAFLHAQENLTDQERATYQTNIASAGAGPTTQALYTILDRNGDSKLSSGEIREALSKPWFAQKIAQVITRYESEWCYKPEKWNALDELMGHTESDPHKSWVEEKARIERIGWWEKLVGHHGVTSDDKIWHLQPIGLIEAFSETNDENDLKWLKVTVGQLTFDAEGNDFSEESHPLHRYFSRVAHWPGNSSGVTIGRGYDLGQRPNPQQDLSQVGVKEPLLSWLLGAKNLQGQQARDYLLAAPQNIRKQEITRKQQYMLFTPVYETMKNKVISISEAPFNIAHYGTLNWDSINSKIQDMIIDLIYRGDYSPATRIYVQRPFVENNISELRSIMSNQSNWQSVPADRFSRRSHYL